MAQPPSFYERPGQTGQLPTPIATGAPIAEGVDAVARAVSGAQASERETDQRVRQSELEDARIERERALQLQTGDTAAYLAEQAGNLQADLIKMREQTAPGAAGYEEQVEARIGKFRDDVTERVGTDPELHARFVDNIASVATNARVGELTWAATQRAKKSADDSDALQNSLQSNIRTAVAAGTFNEQMLADADGLDQRAIEALPIGGNARAQLTKARHLERLVTVVDARTDVDPHAVLADIDAGKYGELDDKVVNVLREHARVAADRLDSHSDQSANAIAARERATAGNLVEDANGGTVVDDRQLQTYRANAAARNKPEDIRLVHDLDAAIAKNKVNAQYGDATQDQRRAAISDIETHKGWEGDNRLRVAHDQLQTLIQRDDQEADHDPVSLYQRQTGQAVDPLNLADPKAMQSRFSVADLAAQRFGKPLPMVFTAPEAKDLREQYNQASVDGKAEFIQTLGAYGSLRARQMMFQIAPTKPELVRLAELGASRDPGVEAIVREAADGAAVPTKEGVAGAVRNLAQSAYGPALARMPGDRQAAILQVATWVYAHRAAQAGKANVFGPGIAQQSIDAALGGTGGKGGIGKRNGGAVVLPMGSTQDDFDRVLALAAAHPDIIRQAANGVPQWGGRDMHTREFLDLIPVLINDTGTQALYAFRSKGGSGYVKTNNGRDDYVVDLRRLAAGLKRIVR
jgi:hypothetical protein